MIYCMERRDLLLLFIAMPGGSYTTDRIRIMKGLFLLTQDGPKEIRGAYEFRPYNYGPFDTSIYHDLERLETEGLIRIQASGVPGRDAYETTSQGEAKARDLEAGLQPVTVSAIRETKRFVTAVSFVDLLRHVYEKHQDYAVKSVARL